MEQGKKPRSQTERRRLLFILYFIPGTPKDILTYFVGLTPIKLSEFLVISLIARFPLRALLHRRRRFAGGRQLHRRHLALRHYRRDQPFGSLGLFRH